MRNAGGHFRDGTGRGRLHRSLNRKSRTVENLNVQQLFEAALVHHKAGRLDDAALQYKRVLEASPEHAAALHNLRAISLTLIGDAQHLHGTDGDRARLLYRMAVALDHDVEAIRERALVRKEVQGYSRVPSLLDFYPADPYADFPHESYALDLQGWNSEKPIFRALIENLKPRIIVEVGSWKGGSAVNMANIVKSIGLTDTRIICIDTWLGGNENWENTEQREFVMPKVEKYSLYCQFMANIIKSDHSDIIIPVPISSVCGLRLLSSKQIRADLIYIDAGHTYEDVKADIREAWRVLKIGGVLLGDDWCPAAPGIIRAGLELEERTSQRIQIQEEKWFIRKTA